MSGERWLLRTGEFLVALAARRLPAAARDERRREWEAELPVILADPEIKPAAARAGRMLWFAADTLRGSALRPGPGPARYRGAHRGAATWGKDDARVLGVLAAASIALLTMLASLLALQAYMVYYNIFDNLSLAGYLTFVLSSLAFLAVRLLWRRWGGAYWYWISGGTVAAATGPHVSALAGHLGWGHPLPFTLISDCGYAVGAACIAMAGVIVIRSVQRDLRTDLQEPAGREKLPWQRRDRVEQRPGIGGPGREKISCAGPSSTTRPCSSTDMVSASWRTRDRSWETNRYVSPSSACSRKSRSTMPACTVTSSAEVGPSRTTTSRIAAEGGGNASLTLVSAAMICRKRFRSPGASPTCSAWPTTCTARIRRPSRGPR
jgi:hypothetical protein